MTETKRWLPSWIEAVEKIVGAVSFKVLTKPAYPSIALAWLARTNANLGDRPLDLLLTHREREVLTWVAMGKTSQDVAAILSISARTVEQHIQNSAQKLGTDNRIHTVVTAIQRGEITL